MATDFSIDARTGTIRVGDRRALGANQSKAAIEPQVAQWLKDARNHGNGYEWLDLGGLTFGGQTASLSLCFHESHFVEATWSVRLPDARMEGGWPARTAIVEEVAFIRGVLAHQIGFEPARDAMALGWGEVWSAFDPRGYLASHGVRYRQS